MRRFELVAIVLLFSLLAAAPPANADRRLALLIANQAYGAEIGPLKNPHNDVRLVGTALAQVGFDIGTPVRDASREQLLIAVHDFAIRLKAAGAGAIGFLYYSGHGVGVGSDNVLIPVGARSTSEREIEIFGVKLTEITDTLNERAPHAVHFIVFDACRSNLGGARGSRGFVPVAERPGMFISFSTAPGATASDEGPGSGPYAAALAAEIVTPRQNHGQLFFAVRTRVAAATQQQQVPWTRDGLLRRVHFGSESPPDPSSAPTLVSPSPLSEAEQVWLLTKESRDRTVLEAFVARYRGTFYAELARARLRAIEQEKAIPTAIAPPPLPKPPASAPRPSPSPKRAATDNCRKETLEQCKARVRAPGMKGSGVCEYANRRTICR